MESVARDLGHETADPNEGADMAAELGEVEIEWRERPTRSGAGTRAACASAATLG